MRSSNLNKTLVWTVALATGALCDATAYAQSSAVIAQACSLCHRDKFEAQASNPHAALESDASQQQTGGELGCLSCHGDVS